MSRQYDRGGLKAGAAGAYGDEGSGGADNPAIRNPFGSPAWMNFFGSAGHGNQGGGVPLGNVGPSTPSHMAATSGITPPASIAAPAGFSASSLLNPNALTAIAGLLFGRGGGGGNSGGDINSLLNSLPELRSALDLQVSQAQRQDPLHAALTQLGLNFLPNSAFGALDGRPAVAPSRYASPSSSAAYPSGSNVLNDIGFRR